MSHVSFSKDGAQNLEVNISVHPKPVAKLCSSYAVSIAFSACHADGTV